MRSHLGIIRCCTGHSSLNILMSSLMCVSAAESYFQWRSTEATDVRCEMMVDGSKLSLNKCMRYLLKWWLLTLKTCHRFVLQKWTNLPQCVSWTWSDDRCRDLDIISTASRECPFALKMARKVSMHVDLMAGFHLSVGQNDVLGEQWLAFGIQWDQILLRQFQKLRKPGSCFLLGSYQYHLYFMRLVDLLQCLRDQLEWQEHIQEAPLIVPGSEHHICPLYLGVQIWWEKLDPSSVGKHSKHVFLPFAPLGKHWS